MTVRIVYEIDCHCGSKATTSTLDTTNPADDGSIHIDVEMAVACTSFECRGCGCTISTGDLDTETEPDECRGAEEVCDGCGEDEADCTCDEDPDDEDPED